MACLSLKVLLEFTSWVDDSGAEAPSWLAWVGLGAGPATGAAAIVVAVLGLRRAGQGRATNRWASIVGLVGGCMGITAVIGLAVIAFLFIGLWRLAAG